MKCSVIAMTPGHSGARRAGRYFPDGAEVVLEVVEVRDENGNLTGEDPPLVKGEGGRMVPDPTKVGTKSFEAIKWDPRLKVLADGSTQGVLSQAALSAAQKAAAEATSEVVAARAEIARLNEENAALAEKLAAAEAKVDGGNKGKGGK